MAHPRRSNDPAARAPGTDIARELRAPDAGMSLVEITVAVVVLAVTAAGILQALISGIGGSARHRDHATATAWLHSAADYLEIAPVKVCGTGTDVPGAYQEDLRANVEPSDEWNESQLEVTAVQYWNGSSFGSTCYEDMQLVTLQVTSPTQSVVETLRVVKSTPYVELNTLPVASDPFSSCAYTDLTMSSDKPGAVTNGPQILVALKKPSLTKTSKPLDDHLRVSLTTSGNCSGSLRIRYEYPHKDHFHTKTVSLKLLKGTTNTYIGKLGDAKYYDEATIDLTVQQGRTKSKTWGTITGGELADKVKFT